MISIIFIIDKMAKREIVPVKVTKKEWEKGIFTVKVDGKKITAQLPTFSNPGEGLNATHVAFKRVSEAMEYKEE